MKMIRDKYPNEKFPINITLSIGVAYFLANEKIDSRTLLDLADQSVYKAKDNSRDRYEAHFVNQ